MRCLSAHPIFIALTLCAGLCGLARAEELAKPDAFVLRFLGGNPSIKKVSACFRHVFTVKYLAEHPEQKVTSAVLCVSGEPDAESKDVLYSYKIRVSLRDRGEQFDVSGSCEHLVENDGKSGSKLSCGGDCGATEFEATLSADGKTAHVAVQDLELNEVGKAEGGARVSLDGSGDDQAYDLERTDPADYARLSQERKQSAAAEPRA
jgi:hypothetical protein